jgi:Holliday junction resolvase
MATRETKLKKQVRDYLRLKGWFVFHVLQGLGAYKGVSDLIAIKEGKTIFLECKAPEGIDKNGRKKPAGKQSENQIQFEADIKAHGGSYYVIRSVEDVIEVIG